MQHVHYFGTNMACFDAYNRNQLAEHEAKELVIAIPVPCPDPDCEGSHMLLLVAATDQVAMAMQPLEEGYRTRVQVVSQLLEQLPDMLVAQFGEQVVYHAMRELEVRHAMERALQVIADSDSSHPRNN